ncbi:MAG: CPBP family intramembrane glutamic endopeptidase [Pseudomonadota bacterium]
MPDLWLPTLSKVLLPGAAIIAMLIAAKRRKLSFADELGLRAPTMWVAALCLAAWICLIALEEHLTGSIEDLQPKHWPDYPAAIIALRVLAIGFLGPVAEELAFRGLLMAALRRMRVAIPWAIAFTAAVWAIIHLQYSPLLLALIFVDGIALGLARYYSKSLYVPIAMHIIGNCFSIYQSLTP